MKTQKVKHWVLELLMATLYLCMDVIIICWHQNSVYVRSRHHRYHELKQCTERQAATLCWVFPREHSKVICSLSWLSQWLCREAHNVNILKMLMGTWKPEECLICQLSNIASCLNDSNSGAFCLLPIEIWQLLIKYLHSDFSHIDSTFGSLVDDNYMVGKHLKIETDPIEQNDLLLKLNKNGYPSSKGHEMIEVRHRRWRGEMVQSVTSDPGRGGNGSIGRVLGTRGRGAELRALAALSEAMHR